MTASSRSAFAKRLALAVLCATLTAAFASGLALQGKHYFYCETMGVLIDDPCVHAQTPHHAATVDEAHFDCCHVGRMPNLPPGAATTPLELPPAAFVAVLAPPPPLVAPPAREASIAERSTGPPPLAASRVHARVMVFLT
jgi:hypothetical protein